MLAKHHIRRSNIEMGLCDNSMFDVTVMSPVYRHTVGLRQNEFICVSTLF